MDVLIVILAVVIVVVVLSAVGTSFGMGCMDASVPFPYENRWVWPFNYLYEFGYAINSGELAKRRERRAVIRKNRNASRFRR